MPTAPTTSARPAGGRAGAARPAAHRHRRGRSRPGRRPPGRSGARQCRRARRHRLAGASGRRRRRGRRRAAARLSAEVVATAATVVAVPPASGGATRPSRWCSPSTTPPRSRWRRRRWSRPSTCWCGPRDSGRTSRHYGGARRTPRRGHEEVSMLKGFKEFLFRGNIIDLAVAVVIGTAFVALVAAFSTYIINPIIACDRRWRLARARLRDPTGQPEHVRRHRGAHHRDASRSPSRQRSSTSPSWCR